MFDRRRTDQEKGSQGREDFSGSLQSFASFVISTLTAVKEISQYLSLEYDATGLLEISKRFERISQIFTDSWIIKTSTYYGIIHRSSARLASVKKVSLAAKAVATLFERYARRPRSYSPVNSRLEINKLCGELENLKAVCK